MNLKTFIGIALTLAFLNMPAMSEPASKDNSPDLEQLNKLTRRYVPTPIKVDISALSPGDHKALEKLIEAARVTNTIYLKQLWNGNMALLSKLEMDSTPLGKARLRYFWINKGPWSELDDYKAFLPDVPARKPRGANLYPANMAKSDFEHWLSTLSPADQEQAKSAYTVVHYQNENSGKKNLAVAPYSKEYAADLKQAAALLREAANLTENRTLKNFLNMRADAFLSNNYTDSDYSWMDVDAPLDITIGPYETYIDELFGYKAAFEAFVCLRNDKETTRLSAFSKRLQEIEDNLPIEPRYRNQKLGPRAIIKVVDDILSAGDGEHGVQSSAYNLPNDELILQKKGSKRVMMKNMQEAKFDTILLPIAKRILPSGDQAFVNFEMFFTHVLAHELSHGLGPHQLTIRGRDTNPRDELKDLYGGIEEAKADLTGLFALQYMMEHASKMGLDKVLPSDETAQRQLYTTYLASAFRSLRFGITEAHGVAMAMQINFMMDEGAFVQNADGTLSVDMQKIKQAVADLDRKVLTIEAEGDYAGAKKLLSSLGTLRPAVKKVLDRLQDIPSDIAPTFVTAEELVADKSK